MTTPYTGVDSFPASIPLPQDNVDKRSAAVMNPCWAGCLDAALYCKNRLGGYRLVSLTPKIDLGSSPLMSNASDAFGSPTMLVSYTDAIPILSGDILEVTTAFHAAHNSTTEDRVEFALKLGGYDTGVSYWENVALLQAEIGTGLAYPITMHAAYQWTLASAGMLLVGLDCRWQVDPGTDYVTIYSPISTSVKVWRAN